MGAPREFRLVSFALTMVRTGDWGKAVDILHVVGHAGPNGEWVSLTRRALASWIGSNDRYAYKLLGQLVERRVLETIPGRTRRPTLYRLGSPFTWRGVPWALSDPSWVDDGRIPELVLRRLVAAWGEIQAEDLAATDPAAAELLARLSAPIAGLLARSVSAPIATPVWCLRGPTEPPGGLQDPLLARSNAPIERANGVPIGAFQSAPIASNEPDPSIVPLKGREALKALKAVEEEEGGPTAIRPSQPDGLEGPAAMVALAIAELGRGPVRGRLVDQLRQGFADVSPDAAARVVQVVRNSPADQRPPALVELACHVIRAWASEEPAPTLSSTGPRPYVEDPDGNIRYLDNARPSARIRGEEATWTPSTSTEGAPPWKL